MRWNILRRVSIDFTTYRRFDPGNKYWRAETFWSGGARSFGEWQGFGFDKNGKVLDRGAPALPAAAVPFALSRCGQDQCRRAEAPDIGHA